MKTPLRSLKTALTGLLSAFAIAAYSDNASSFQPVTTADRTTTNVTDIVWSASSGDAAELYDTVASTVEFDTGDAALSYSPAANDAGTDPASTTVNLQFSAAATAPAVPTGAQTAITVYIVNGVTNYYVYAKGAYGASGAPTAEAGWVEVPTLVPDTTQAVSVQISIDYDQDLARYVIGGVNAGDYYLANTPDGTTVAKKINSLNFAGSGVLSSTITTKAKAAYAILDEGTSPATTTYYDTLAAAEAGYASATTPTLKRVAASSPYAETPVTFTVNFVDENGTTVLNTQTLAYGAPVAYAGLNSPSKADSGSNTYTWTGWNDGTTDYGTSDSLPIATADATYTATYKAWTMITPPSAAQNLVYNGAPQDGIEDNAAYTRGDAYSAKNVGTYTASVALADKANTVWSDTKTTVDKTYTWSIAAKTLGLSWSNTTLTYNGSSQAPTATLTGVEGSDDVTVAVSGDRTDVGTYNATADSLGGADAGNYALPALKTQQFSIAKKALAVTANAKTITYGDAPANDGVTYSGFVAGEDENNLSGTLAYAYDYTQYGNVGNYTITPSGLTSSNYDITFNAGTLQVTQKEVGLTWDDNTFAYDGNAHPAATATGLVNGDQIDVTVSGTETDVGSYTATASGLTGTQAANYTLPAANTQAFEITGAALANFAVTLADWTYGSTAATPTVSGNDGNGTVTITYSADGTTFSAAVPTAAGSYTVKAEVPAAGNYAAGTATDTFAILPATITVTAEATTQVYGDQPSRIAYTVSGLVNGEPEGNAGLSGALSFDQSAGAGAAGRTYPDVDAYPITAGDLVIGSGGNYTLGSIVTAGVSYTVTPAALEVKAEDASVPHGTAPANLTFASPAYTVTGLVNGDTEASVFGANAISVSSPSYVQTASLSDTFPIIPAYTYNGYNYTVTAQNGTLSISSVTFPIEFVNWDNSHIDTVQVEYGDIPSTGASPTRPNDQANSYQFVGWENAGQQYPVGTALPAATAAATYTAYYDGTAVPYTVTFVDFNGTNIVQQTIGYGGYPTAPTGLTRASDNVYSYTFAGWLDSNNNSVTPNTVAVTGNVTYTADYTSTFVEYRITFLDGDPATGNGTILWYNDYHYNDVPAFGGTPSTPIRVSTSLSWYWRFNDRWLWEYDNQYYPANSLLPVTSQGKYYADFRKVWIKGIVPTVLTNTTTIANYRTVTGNSAAVSYRLADAEEFTSQPSVTATPAGATAANGTLTIADLTWNAKQDWTITTSVTEDEQTLTETLAGSLYAKDKTAWFSEETLGTVTGFGDDITEGVAPAAASAAGQQVRINTRLDISDSGMDTVPAVGSARGGFAVLQLTGDTAPAYYAYTGDSTLGTDGWVKLSGAAPVAGEHDVLITVDTATDEAYYYVDGASLYIDGETKTYAIPVATGTTVSAIGFANPDGVKSAVVGEYDVPYVAAIGTTGYTTAAAAISAVAKDGTETLELLANVDPAATINLASGESVKVKAGSFTGLTVSTEVSGKEVRTSDPVDGVVTYDLVDSTATVIWVVEGRDNVEVDYQIGATPVYPQDAAAPEKASTDQYSYTFAGWAATAGGEVLAPLPDVAAGGATYYAVFNQAVRSYTITWKNDDGTTIDTTTVEYGQTPTHADASKVADETYTYEFAGWDPSVANVSGPATYTAEFNSIYRDYTITWNYKAANGTDTSDTTTVHYGATPSHADPAGYTANGNIYTFSAWNTTPAAYDGTVTSYTAQYTSAAAKATVISVADGTTTLYPTVAAAIAAADVGDTVKLLDNCDTGIGIGAGTNVVIDLGGYTLTNPNDCPIWPMAGTLVVSNGTIRTALTGADYSAIYVNGGDLTLGDDLVVDATVVSANGGQGGFGVTVAKGGTVTVDGATINAREMCVFVASQGGNATVNVVDGTLTSTDNAVIGGYGTSGYGGNTINVSGGTLNASIVSDGYAACGIYAPNDDTVNISGGTINVTGGAGVVARAGSVNITGGTINTTGNTTGKVGDSRVVVPCAAVVFDSEAAYPGYDSTESGVTIEGGTFVSEVTTVQLVGDDEVIEIPATVNGQPNPAVFSDADADGVPEGYALVKVEGSDPPMYAITPKATVIWIVDGTETTESYAIGETPVYPGATPTKAATDSAVYTFTGWEPAIGTVTAAGATYTAQFSALTVNPVAQELYYNCTGVVSVVGAPEGATFYWNEEVIPGPSSGSGSGYSFSGDVKPLSVSSGRKADTLKFYSNTTNGTWHLTALVTNDNAQVAQLVSTVTVKDVAAVVNGVEYTRAQWADAIAAAKANDQVLGIYLSAPSVTLAAGETLQVKVLATRNVVNLPTVTGPAGTDETVYVVSKAKDNATGVTTFSLTAEDPSVMFTSADGQTVKYLDASFKATEAGTYKLLKNISRSQLSVGTTGVVLDLNGNTLTSTATGTTAAINVTSTTGTASLTVVDTSADGTGAIVAPNYSAIQSGKNATVSIQSGAISGKTVLVYTLSGGTVAISGGTFSMVSGSADSMLNCKDDNRGTITVTGGSFNGFNPSTSNAADGDMVASGYYAFPNDPSSGWYTVAEKKSVIGTTITLTYNTTQYDGTASEPAATVSFDGNDLVADTDYTVAYADNVNVGTATVTITGQGGWVDSTNVTFTITKRPLSLTAMSDSKVYDGTALTAEGIVYDNPGEILDGHSVATYVTTGSQTDAGTSDNVLTSVTIKDADQVDVTANYELTLNKGTLTVTRAPIAFPTAATGLVYDGTEKTGVAAGTGYTLSGTTAATAADDYTAIATPDSNHEWSAADYVPASIGATDPLNLAWSIAKASITVTVTGTDAASAAYTGNEQTANVAYTLASNDALYDASKVSYSGAATVSGTAVGSYPFGLAAAKFAYGDANVDATFDVTDAAFAITKATITVTVTGTPASETYDGTAKTANVAYTLACNDSLYVESKVSYTGSATVTGTDAGSYPFGLAAAQFSYDDANVDATFDVTDAALTITRTAHTVLWVVDGTTVETDENVAWGTEPSFGGETPAKDSSASTDYTFSGWSDGTTVYGLEDELPLVTANVTYTAQFSETTRKYTVTWNADGGTLSGEYTNGEVDYGTAIVAPTAAKADDEDYTYEFLAWEPALEATVTSNMSYTATYTATPKAATVIKIALDAPTLDATGTSGKAITVAADFGSTEISGAVDVTATPNGTVGDATAGVATATFPAEWNQGVEWTIADATANSTVAPLTGKTYLKAETAWDMTSASAEGQAVRIQTSIEFDPVGVTQGPTVTADDRGGITVVNGKYAAFNGTTWVELSGPTPKEGAVDLLMVADMDAASPTVRYYIDGVALYAGTAANPQYAIPLKTGNAYLTGVAATDTDATVTFTAEYDVPYRVAVGNTAWTDETAAAVAAAIDKTGATALELLGDDVALSIELADGDSLLVLNADNFATGSGVTAASGCQLSEETDGDYTTYTAAVIPAPTYTGAVSGGVTILATDDAANPTGDTIVWTDFTVNGDGTVTAEFTAPIGIVDGTESTANLPFAVVYKTSLDGEKITSANNAASVTITFEDEEPVGGTAVITLPSGVTNSFFLFGFDNGPAENAGN